MKSSSLAGILLLAAMFTMSCTSQFVKDKNAIELSLPEQLLDYQNTLPDNFFAFNDNTPADNQITNAGATLGRVLFYDGALSFNNSVSCATCHKQNLAFADNKAGSIGFEGRTTPRNTPPIMNMRFSNSFFWDMRTTNLETQVLQPVENHIEMGMEDPDFLVQKLSAIEYYPSLFKEAFGTEEISKQNISKALAQFIRSMTSFDSRMDKQLLNGEQVFSDLENQGMQIFVNSSCNNCHRIVSNGGPFEDFGGYNGTGDDLANIGLDMIYDDNGANDGRFKVPSLRNLKYTAPYMHDGRFNTLEEVIDHYSSGIQEHEKLDSRLKMIDGQGNQKALKLNFTQHEKDALLSFLLTLEDTKLLQDEKYSDPFIR
jgi:cytochrome c peroxidase